METINQKIRKAGAINGVIFGIIFLVLGIFLFYFVTSMTTSFWMITIVGPIGITFLIPIGVAIWLCFDLRKKIGGFWSFRQATTGIFIMFFVCYLVSTTGNLGFSTLIEPEMTTKMKTVYANATTQMMTKQGVDQEKIDKQVADLDSKFEDPRSPGKLAKGLAISIIFDFVFALIFAAFFKKEPLLTLDGQGEAPIDETV
jgi:hypothetical protein